MTADVYIDCNVGEGKKRGRQIERERESRKKRGRQVVKRELE